MRSRHVQLLAIVVVSLTAIILFVNVDREKEEQWRTDGKLLVERPTVMNQSLYVATADAGSSTRVRVAGQALRFDEFLEVSNQRTGEKVYLAATGAPVSETLPTREGDPIHVTLRNYQREEIGEGQDLGVPTHLSPSSEAPDDSSD